MADAQIVPGAVDFKAEDDVVVLTNPARRTGIAPPQIPDQCRDDLLVKAVSFDLPVSGQADVRLSHRAQG